MHNKSVKPHLILVNDRAPCVTYLSEILAQSFTNLLAKQRRIEKATVLFIKSFSTIISLHVQSVLQPTPNVRWSIREKDK